MGTNHGTNYGTSLVSSGKLDGGAEFQSGDYIDCGSDSSIDGDPFSFATWVYLTQTTSGTNNIQCIAAKDDNYANRLFWMTEWDGQLSVRVGSNAVTAAGPSPTLNTWQHLAVTYDGTTFRFYVDGVEQSSNTETTVGGVGYPLTLGAESASYRTLKNGARLDDARFYNVELTAQEIADLYAYDGTTTTPQTANLDVAAGSLSTVAPAVSTGPVSVSTAEATATLVIEAISASPGVVTAQTGSADASLSANQAGTAQITVVSASVALISVSAGQIAVQTTVSVGAEAASGVFSAPIAAATPGTASVSAENAASIILAVDGAVVAGPTTASAGSAAAVLGVSEAVGTPGVVTATTGSADMALSASQAGQQSVKTASVVVAAAGLTPEEATVAATVTVPAVEAVGAVTVEAPSVQIGAVTASTTTGTAALSLLGPAILLGGESAVTEVASAALSPFAVTATPGATTATSVAASSTIVAPEPVIGTGVFAVLESASGSFVQPAVDISWDQTAPVEAAPVTLWVDSLSATPGTATATTGSADMALSAFQVGTAAVELVTVDVASAGLSSLATDTVAVVSATTAPASATVTVNPLSTALAEIVAVQAASGVLGLSEPVVQPGALTATSQEAVGSLSFAPASVQIGAVQSLAEPAEVTLGAQDALLSAEVAASMVVAQLASSAESVSVTLPTVEIGAEAAVMQLLVLDSLVQLLRRLSDTGLNSIELDGTPSFEARPTDGTLALDPTRSFELLDDGDTSVDI